MFDLKDIYKEYGKSVYRFLLSLTGDPILAEELVQNKICIKPVTSILVTGFSILRIGLYELKYIQFKEHIDSF